MTPSKLLEALGRAEWSKAEDTALELLHSGRFRDQAEWCTASVAIAQARIIGRLDPKGALRALAPVIANAHLGLDPTWSARANVVSAILFATPSSFMDRERASREVVEARARLQPDGDVELMALSAIALLGGGVTSPICARIVRHQVHLTAELERAEQPVNRVLAREVQGAANASHDRRGAILALEEGLELACAIGFDAAEARISLALARLHDGASAKPLLASALAALRRSAIDAPWLRRGIEEREEALGLR